PTSPPPPRQTLLPYTTLFRSHSGLPPMPDNFGPFGNVNSWADYGPQQLYAYLTRHGVAKPADATFIYSNLGVGLLGQVLADRARSEEHTSELQSPDQLVFRLL